MLERVIEAYKLREHLKQSQEVKVKRELSESSLKRKLVQEQKDLSLTSKEKSLDNLKHLRVSESIRKKQEEFAQQLLKLRQSRAKADALLKQDPSFLCKFPTNTFPATSHASKTFNEMNELVELDESYGSSSKSDHQRETNQRTLEKTSVSPASTPFKTVLVQKPSACQAFGTTFGAENETLPPLTKRPKLTPVSKITKSHLTLPKLSDKSLAGKLFL